MDIIAEHGPVLLILAGIFGLYMTWGIGANDLANAMGTSVGSKAISIKQAIIIAGVMEFAGAFLAGGHVTGTIRKGIIDPMMFESEPHILVFGMLASLLAAATWLLIASRRGWPVSTTHSIVGAIIGFGLVSLGPEAIDWYKTGQIVASWVVSPVIGGTLAFLLMISVRRLILETPDPTAAAKKWGPVYVFFVGFIIALVTVFKGLKHLNIDLTVNESFVFAVFFGLFTAGVAWVLARNIDLSGTEDSDYGFAGVEKIFAPMMLFTAGAMAFAHGSNDVANGIGPMAAVVSIINEGGVTAKAELPNWVLLVGGGGIVLGLATMGYKVIATVGEDITQLTPSRGFCAELAAASTVVLATRTGLPVSTTHVLVGSVIGVGLARGLSALDVRVIGTIIVSWVVTLPIGGALSALFFFTLKGMFT